MRLTTSLLPSAPPPVDAEFPPPPAPRHLVEVLDARPALERQLPPSISTPAGKLLYLVTHRELGAGPLSVPIGATDSIRRLADGSLALSSPGRPTLRLNDQHGDLARLLDGAHLWDGMETTTLDALLSEAVHRFYADPRFDGGGAALNERGGRAFTYATIQQVLVSDDPSQRGLECLASAAVHLWKSAGLVPPHLTREEFEHRYTSIHGDRGPTVRLGPEFDRTLRGGRAVVRLDAAATVAFANTLRSDDWAKLTGAAKGHYAVRSLRSIDEVAAHLAAGGAGVRTTWADGGHYFLLTGAHLEDGQMVVNEDDSLRRSPATRTTVGEEPYRTPYDERSHTRFWTLERR